MSNNTATGFRLSIQQERLWSQQASRASQHWTECEIRVEGPLDSARLQETIRGRVGRHEILRTVFHRRTGLKLPLQVILDATDFKWNSVDLVGLDGETQRERVCTLASRRGTGFNQEGGEPPLQVALAKLAPQEHTLVISLPALCGDLRSMENLATEIGRAYASTSGEAEEIMQYADVAEWQHELLASDDAKAGKDYWREHCRNLDFSALDSALSAFDTKSTADFSPEVVVKEVQFPQLISRSATSLQDFLLTCWHVFLARITSRPGVVVGCQVDGRNHAELSNAIGLFTKYLPQVPVFREDTTFETLLEQVKRESADLRNWQDSFSWGNAGQTASPEHGPMLPVAFDFAELDHELHFGTLKFTVLRAEACDELFHLKLSARRCDHRLWLEFHFDSSRLDRETVKRWSTNFVMLMAAAIADPGTVISRLPILDEAERKRLLVGWNQTAADYPRNSCIHALFETQTVKTPDLPAVRYQDECLTYRQLNEKSNRLAHHLRVKGVQPNSPVALCVERSTTMMVAVLAILKAGGAYVPISADHPKSRLAQQLAAVSAVVTEGKFECQMPSFDGPTVLLDRHSGQWADQPSTNPDPVTNPENLAYVIYTSGSTGTPKGVAVRHRNLVNYTLFIQRRLELEKLSQPLHFATVSTLGADLGNTCIYPSLVSGGCLHVIGHEVAADSRQLGEYLAKYPVDVLKIVPSHLMALLNSGGGKEVLPRKYLVMGGEAFPTLLMEKIAAAGGSCEVLNHYGPTETTIGSLTLRLKEFDWQSSPAQTIPIGKPIANTRIYLLDLQGEPVPVGVVGELYIAGDGVSAGYLGQLDLTTERFVPEYFVSDSNAKMYRTGDLARYLPDGTVEFLGRADDQVKIRGFRIELGEIESVLLKHSLVKQAVVLAPADERGEKSLAAYFVGSASAEDLRTYLRGHLPDYMIPAAFIALPKFPLNANGKVDRPALPRPQDVKSHRKGPIAPRTPGEEVVASIWIEVLKRENIGVEDNFFDIGGHSLLATQIASRLREHFHISVPVRAVFESPTIRDLAKCIDTIRREERGLVPPQITPVPRSGNLPLSYAQERVWVLDQLEPRSPLYNIPRSFRLRGPLHVDALEKGLNEIVRRHESQRTTFESKDGHPFQVVAPALILPLVLRDLSRIAEENREAEARRLAIEEAMRPFDLRTGPLLRALLIRLKEDDHVLQVTMHHIVSDAWSAGIFIQELGSLYEAFCEGQSSPLPELTVQYADYAVQEREWLQGEVLEKQLAFWRHTLKGAPQLINLPLDRPRPGSRTYQGACEMLGVAPETVQALKALGREEGATLFMTLMACFQLLLSKYSGEEQVVVGTDLANRMMPETERMIGFFINLLAIRTDLSGNPTFRELLSRVREQLFEAYAHQEVPFPKIVEAIQPERSATHNPVVQVLFVMQNTPSGKREFGGLQLEPFELPIMTSKFDMAVFVQERHEGLVGYWIYSTELFERSTIRRMLRHFGNLMENVLSGSARRISAISILTAEEIEREEAEKRKRKQSQLDLMRSAAPVAVLLKKETGEDGQA